MMSMKKKRRSLKGISLALSLGMVLFSGLWKLVQAESDPDSYRQNIPGMVNFEPPPDRGEPKDTVMGGSRGNCPVTTSTAWEEPMTLLMPEGNYGLTVAAHPKLFIYIPQSTKARALFVKLKDENERDHYQKIVPIKSGIVNILPSTAPSLEIGKTYQVFAVMLCKYNPEQEEIDPEQPYSLDDPWTQAEIKRIAPNSIIGGDDDTIPGLQRAALYAEKGIWVDTLAILAELRQAKPEDQIVAREWKQLLTAAGMETISAQKFAE